MSAEFPGAPAATTALGRARSTSVLELQSSICKTWPDVRHICAGAAVTPAGGFPVAARFAKFFPFWSASGPFSRRAPDLWFSLGGGEPQIKKFAHGIGLDVDPHPKASRRDLLYTVAAHAKLNAKRGASASRDPNAAAFAIRI